MKKNEGKKSRATVPLRSQGLGPLIASTSATLLPQQLEFFLIHLYIHMYQDLTIVAPADNSAAPLASYYCHHK